MAGITTHFSSFSKRILKLCDSPFYSLHLHKDYTSLAKPNNDIRYFTILLNQDGHSFYLSMEEYIARNFNEDEYFFMWQVEPLALVGRNQLIDNEINF